MTKRGCRAAVYFSECSPFYYARVLRKNSSAIMIIFEMLIVYSSYKFNLKMVQVSIAMQGYEQSNKGINQMRVERWRDGVRNARNVKESDCQGQVL